MKVKKKTRKQQDRSLETKKIILESAFDLFTNKIYSDVKIEEIAKNAGISKGAVFHHFPDGKKELLHSVIERFINNMGYDLAHRTEELLNDPKKAIQMLIDGTLMYFIKYPRTLYIFTQMIDLELLTSHSKSKSNRFELGKLYESYMVVITELLEKMNIKNPRGTAHVIASALDGLMVQLHYFNVKSVSNKYVKDFRDGIYHLLGFSEIPSPLDESYLAKVQDRD
jgi:AcrR family transcriptional regulator